LTRGGRRPGNGLGLRWASGKKKWARNGPREEGRRKKIVFWFLVLKVKILFFGYLQTFRDSNLI
jgi:hypothetical protein